MPPATTVAFALSPYTTTAYLYSDFQPTGADLTGAYSDVGVDTNYDGKYNTLWSAQASTSLLPEPTAWSAASGTARTASSPSASRSYSLTTGVQTATLEFDGVTIRAHGVDGPYKVAGSHFWMPAGQRWPSRLLSSRRPPTPTPTLKAAAPSAAPCAMRPARSSPVWSSMLRAGSAHRHHG